MESKRGPSRSAHPDGQDEPDSRAVAFLFSCFASASRVRVRCTMYGAQAESLVLSSLVLSVRLSLSVRYLMQSACVRMYLLSALVTPVVQNGALCGRIVLLTCIPSFHISRHLRRCLSISFLFPSLRLLMQFHYRFRTTTMHVYILMDACKKRGQTDTDPLTYLLRLRTIIFLSSLPFLCAPICLTVAFLASHLPSNHDLYTAKEKELIPSSALSALRKPQEDSAKGRTLPFKGCASFFYIRIA